MIGYDSCYRLIVSTPNPTGSAAVFPFFHCYLIHAITSDQLQLKYIGVRWSSLKSNGLRSPLWIFSIFSIRNLFGNYFSTVSSNWYGAGLLRGCFIPHFGKCCLFCKAINNDFV